MLHLLSKYSRDHELVAEPGFRPKDVRWVIVFSADGRFLEVVELGDTSQRRNPGRTFTKCPDLSQPELKRGGRGCRHFLVDSVDVVALYAVNQEDPKLLAKHIYFVSLLETASRIDPTFGLVARALSEGDVLKRIGERLRAQQARYTDKITFEVGGFFLVDSDVWHHWWREFRRNLGTDSSAKKPNHDRPLMRCFASGELVEPAATHPKIKGLADVGGLAMGDALASFKQDSFTSYGLQQSSNAAVSEDEASSYRAALEKLLETQSQRLCGAKVVHWFARKVTRDDDPFLLLDEGLSFLNELGGEKEQEIHAQNRARQLLNAIRTGKRPDLHDNSYCALTLSGAAGRVMIRDWMEGQFEELIDSVNDWFNALEIVHFSGTRVSHPPGIERLITCLLPIKRPQQEYKDWVRPIGAERLSIWHAALRKTIPIPVGVLSRMVELNVRFNQTAQFEEALDDRTKFPGIVSLQHARMSLMKAFHIRQGDQSMKTYLNEEHPSPAYHCGRLMAVLAAVQRKSLPGVSTGIVQRYYAAASSTPALVLGRLTRTSQFHLGDINKSKPRLAHWYETKIASIWGRISDRLPTLLSLEEQSLFALGYYQQLASDRSGAVENHDLSEETSNE